jgi:ribosomal protein S18 acetylase RimI-like enzyme
MTGAPDLPITIRGAEPGDEDGIGRLRTSLAASPLDEASWPPNHLLNASDTRHIVAVRNHLVVATAIRWRNALHPRRHRLSLGVHSDHRRQGLGRALWLELGGKGGLGWQTGVGGRNVTGQAMLRELGFQRIMRTRLADLRPNRVPSPRRDAIGEGWKIASLNDAPVAFSEPRILARLHRDVYADQHTWDPVDERVLDDEASDLFVGRAEDRIVPDLTALAWRAEEPVGVGSLWGDIATGSVDLGWIGVTPVAGSDQSAIVAALTDWCLVRAAELGVAVSLEVDDANAPVLAALGRWHVDWTEDWLTLALDHP